MTRSAVFELENGLCYRPAHPFCVKLNGQPVCEAQNTNVFSLFSLLPGTAYTVEVQAEGETLKLDFTTEAETFFVDASRYGLVADGETDNTVRLQAALSTAATARGRHAMRLTLGFTHQSPFSASQSSVPSPVTTTSCTCVMFNRPAKLSSGLPSQPVR